VFTLYGAMCKSEELKLEVTNDNTR